jgi:hypothetical protein
MAVLLLMAGNALTAQAVTNGKSAFGTQRSAPVEQRVTYYKYCGLVTMPLGEGWYRMGVIESGPITCTKAKRVWRRFRIWYDHNPGPGRVTILHFRCSTWGLVSNARCVRGSRYVRSDLELGTLPY